MIYSGCDRIRQRGQAGRALQEGRRDATVLSVSTWATSQRALQSRAPQIGLSLTRLPGLGVALQQGRRLVVLE
jgi:hypothetical protein